VLRILDGGRAFIGLEQLGMLDDTFAHYQELIARRSGWSSARGPTGSGKTTTLYATLSAINDEGINIVTIEDPVEYLFPSINQIQTNDQAASPSRTVSGRSSARTPTRSSSARSATWRRRASRLQAALTGHFVMSSLHATDAPAALQRFMDMGSNRS